MKIIHQGGFSVAELSEFRPVVYKNVLESAQHIITYMQRNAVELQHLNQVPLCLPLPHTLLANESLLGPRRQSYGIQTQAA